MRGLSLEGKGSVSMTGSSSIFSWVIFCSALTVGRGYSPSTRGLGKRLSFMGSRWLLPSPKQCWGSFSEPPLSVLRLAYTQRHHHACTDLYSVSQEAVGDSAATSCKKQGELFNDQVWEVYMEMMRDIMTRDRVTKQLNSQEMQAVEDYLLSNLPFGETQSISEAAILHGACVSFHDTVAEKKTDFLNSTGFNKSQYEYLTRCLSYTADMCAKKQLSEPVLVTWHKMKECGLVPREKTVSTYMYVLGLSPDTEEACLEVATFHDLLFDSNEKTVTLRIKSLIADGDATAAERLLESLPCKGGSQEWKRLRTFSPILHYYCEHGQMEKALRLFRQMRESDGVYIDAEAYSMLIIALAQNGCFRINSKPIYNVSAHGFSVSNGPRLFDELATEMAEDILELPEEAALSISDALNESCFGENEKDGRGFIGRVTINSTTASCPETGAKLQLFALTDEQRSKVQDTLLDMAATQHEEFGEKLRARGKIKESRDGQYAYEQLCKFSRWLSDRDGEPFTAIMDGPNIAYYGHANVHYSQIELVLEELEKLGERPLVVMPQKYTARNFWLTSLGCTQELSEKDISVVKELMDSGKMYVVPTGCLDDYYWMLASVASQPRDLSETDASRLPGLRPLLITNDQMRDHKLSLLEPKSFRRWTSCHIVNYDISSCGEDESESRQVEFSPADIFSKEIQGNKAKTRGGNVAWHFPVSEWPEPDWLCVCLPH